MDVAAAKGGDGTQNPFTASGKSSSSSPSASQGTATSTPKSAADKAILAHGMLLALIASSSIFLML